MGFSTLRLLITERTVNQFSTIRDFQLQELNILFAAAGELESLKALALVRLNRSAEAWKLIEEIEKEEPNEEHALQALTYCFKDLAMPDRIAVLYEGVCSRVPQNEEYLTHLFMAYVRLRDFKKQQKTAQELFRLTKKSSYYFWSVMSTAMQAMTDPVRASSVFYPLAEGMVKKFVTEEKIQSESEVTLYALLLKQQGKHKELLDLLQGALSDQYLKCMWNKQYVILDSLKALNQWKEVLEMCCRILPSQANDWKLYLALFDSVFFLIATKEMDKTELIQRTTDVLLDLIEADRDNEKGWATRGPYLARLHWIMGLLEREYVVRAELGEPLNLLIEYFRLFAQKPCCFSDMRPYLCLLGEQQQDEFLDSISDIASLPYSAFPADLELKFAETPDDLQRHVCCIQLSRCLGKHATMSADSRQRLGGQCLLRYRKALDLGENLHSSECQFGDSYILMALHVLCDIYQEQVDSALLNQMVLVAEAGLKNSPSNFHLRYILAKLYALLGAGDCVMTVRSDMALKHIQDDTLGYLVFDQLSPFGLFQDLSGWLLELGVFFAQSEKETMESLVSCYKVASFSKIGEIIEFDKKLQTSFHRTAAQIVRKHIMVLTYCNSVESLSCMLKLSSLTNPYSDAVDWTSLSDNRDFFCHPCWDPGAIEEERDEERKRSFQEHIDILKFRQLVLRILALMCEDGMTDRNRTCADHLRTLLSQLKAHYRHCRANHSDASVWNLGGPLPTHFNVYLQGGYFEILTCFLESASCIIRQKCSDGGVTETQVGTGEEDSPERMRALPSTDELQALFRRMVSSHQLGTGTPGDAGSQLRFPHMQLCHLSYLIQTVGLCLLVAAVSWHHLTGPSRTNETVPGKKVKKKQHPKSSSTISVSENGVVPKESALAAQLRDVIAVVCQAPQSIRRMVEDIETVLGTAELYTMNLGHSVRDTENVLRSEVWNKLKGSYSKSLKEMTVVIAHQENVASKLMADAK